MKDIQRSQVLVYFSFTNVFLGMLFWPSMYVWIGTCFTRTQSKSFEAAFVGTLQMNCDVEPARCASIAPMCAKRKSGSTTKRNAEGFDDSILDRKTE